MYNSIRISILSSFYAYVEVVFGNRILLLLLFLVG
jgi:hypothetical protein